MISTLAIENYRSIRRLVMPLKGVNVVTGANGTGKSSLYRALRLLADSSHNGAVAALAREGGLGPTLWAGPEAGRAAPIDGAIQLRGPIRVRHRSASNSGLAARSSAMPSILACPQSVVQPRSFSIPKSRPRVSGTVLNSVRRPSLPSGPEA